MAPIPENGFTPRFPVAGVPDMTNTPHPLPPVEVVPPPTAQPRLFSRPVAVWVGLGALALIYGLTTGPLISRAYIDLGDGNYLYTSSRMADGLMIYRDFLSPQPPLHLLTGSALIRLGRFLEAHCGLEDGPLMTVRVFSRVLHLLTMLCIWGLGRRLTGNRWGGILAATLYLLLPLNFWWSLGYQSELLEILWLYGALGCFVRFRPAPMAAAGALMGLAVLTNMTAVPYAAANLVFLCVRHGWGLGNPRRGGWKLVGCYLLPFLLVTGAFISYYELRTGAYFLNVVSNQVGSYPKGGFWGYAVGKVLSQGGKILVNEGGFILIGLFGLMAYNRRERGLEREYLVWYALALLLSVLYVTKGGTMDYIFTLGEPVLALFGAYFLTRFFRPGFWSRYRPASLWHDTALFPQIAFGLLLAIAAFALPARFYSDTLRQRQFEQSEEGLDLVAHYIERYSKPGDTIVSDPYYAFITRRLLAEEYSELFLWTLKYSLEREAMLLQKEEVPSPETLAAKLLRGEGVLAGALVTPIPLEFRRGLADRLSRNQPLEAQQANDLLAYVNYTLRDKPLYSPAGFANVKLPEEVQALVATNPIGADLARLNRLLFEAVYPDCAKPGAAHQPDGEGILKVKAIAARLRARTLPIVIASTSEGNLQVLRSEEIRSAVETFYKPLIPAENRELTEKMKTLNFQMQIFVPKSDAEMGPEVH